MHAETIEAVRAKLRWFFELPDLQIEEDTELVSLLCATDPDRFTDFLFEFDREFGVAMPRFQNPVAPSLAERGFFDRILDRLVGPDDGQPTHVIVDHITLRELAEIADARQWPLRFAAKRKK